MLRFFRITINRRFLLVFVRILSRFKNAGNCVHFTAVNNILYWAVYQCLPRDAMHTRSLCRRAVSVRPSVCLGVCLSRLCIVSKWVNICSIFFSLPGSHTIVHSPYQTYGNVPTKTPQPGRLMQCGYKKSWFSTNISIYLGNDTR